MSGLPRAAKISIKEARRVLAEFPDADLSAIKVVDEEGVEHDGDLLAMEEAAKNIAKITGRLHASRYPNGCRGTVEKMCEACAYRLFGITSPAFPGGKS